VNDGVLPSMRAAVVLRAPHPEHGSLPGVDTELRGFLPILCHSFFLPAAVELTLFGSLTGTPEVKQAEALHGPLTCSSTNGMHAAKTMAPSSILHQRFGSIGPIGVWCHMEKMSR
jgi:hypothetical protein